MDIFDTVADAPPPAAAKPASAGGDIFDQVAANAPAKGDMFDRVAARNGFIGPPAIPPEVSAIVQKEFNAMAAPSAVAALKQQQVEAQGGAVLDGPDALPVAIGKFSRAAGDVAKRMAGAYAFEATGQPEEQLRQFTDPDGQTPLDEGMRALSLPGRVLSKAAYGLVETAPQLGMMAATEGVGVPAPLAAAGLFGSTPTGFDPRQAAIAAALPFVGGAAGDVVAKVAQKFGLEAGQAMNVLKGLGGMAGAAGVLGADQVARIQDLPPEQRKDAYVDAISTIVGQSLLGPSGVKFGKPGEAALEMPVKLPDGQVSEFGGVVPPVETVEAPSTPDAAPAAVEVQTSGAAEAVAAAPAEAAAPAGETNTSATDDTVTVDETNEAGGAPAVAPVEAVPDDEAAPATAPPVQLTLDDKLQSLKIDTQGKLLEGVTSLPVHIWNASIDVIRAAVAGGKLLNDAVQHGVDWLRANHPSIGFDEQEYRQAVLDQYGTREFGRKLQADPDVAPAVKSQAREYIYQRRTNESDLQAAQRIVQERGVDGATTILKDSQAQVPGPVRSMLGQFLVKSLADQERAARASGDTAGAEALVGKQVDVGNTVLKLSTDLAQSLQAFSVFGRMSPQGMLQFARSQFQAFGDRVMSNVSGPAELIRQGLNEANQRASEGVKNDPAVNAAARDAVDAHVGTSDATKRAAIVEITGSMAESPEVVRQARATLAGRLNEVLQQKPDSLAKLSKAELNTQLDDLSKRAAGIAANHYQGAEPGKPLAAKFQERLGLGPESSKRLAHSMDLTFANMVKQAAEKIPWRVAKARAAINQPFKPGEVLPGSVDAEIRRQLVAMNVKLGDLVTQHGAKVDATGRSIGDRVVADSGLTGPHAETLRQAFNERWTALANAAKTSFLKRLGKQAVVPRQLQGALPDLLKLANAGAFDDAKYYDALKTKLRLPQLTPDVATEIVRRGNVVQGLPEGFQRDRASAQLLNYIASQKPLRIWDLPMAMWYANTLSGFSTPVHIMFDNLNSLAGTSLVSLIRNPTAGLDMAGALGRGMLKGAQHAGEILKTGVVTDVKSGVHTSPLLELNPFKGPLDVLNYWKYVGRGLSATHVLMFKPAMELRQTLAARDIAASEGLRGEQLRARVNDLLANTSGQATAARAQAASEGLTGLDLSRRTNEILEQQREGSMPGSTETARDFALRSTYLNEPYGALGHVTKGINQAINGIGQDHPKLGFVPRMLVPFTRIVGNIVNEKLNWTPIGTLRSMEGFRSGELYGKPISDAKAPGDLLAKSILGTTATAAVAAMAAQYLNDPDPKFAITGNGPADADKRKQLIESGWHAHSVKVGDKYFDYTRTPMAIEMAVMGNYLDGLKYRHLDNSDALNRVAIVLKGTGDTIVHQSFLDSIANIFEALGDQNTKTGGQKLEATMARTASGLVVPNLVSQVDRFFDPTKYDATDTAGMLRQQIPFVRRLNDPVLNALGEPVKMGVFDRDFGSDGTDPVWRLLAVKQAWIPAAHDEVIGNKKLGPDHYRALTPDEQYALTAESGPKIRERIEAQYDRLADMPDDRARKIIDAITKQERARVLERMGR